MQLGIPKVIQGRLTNPHPVDLQAAQMCLPFSVALASHVPLATGRIPTLAVADYEAGLSDRRLYEIEERTTIALDDEVEAASNALSTAAKVERAPARRARARRNSCRRRKAAPAIPSPAAGARGALRAGTVEPRLRQGLRRDHRDVEGSRPARPAPARANAERIAPSLTDDASAATQRRSVQRICDPLKTWAAAAASGPPPID